MDMDSDKRTLYIGNLDKNVTEEVLYELFLQAGPIERVNICSNNNDSFRFGFVTYKHEVSIDYAIKLYKGVNLYKKELLIRKKGARNNSNQQQNEFKYGTSEEGQSKPNMDFQNIAENLRAWIQQKSKPIRQMFESKSNSLKGNWSSRKKPYDRGSRNHFSRFRESRDRHKDKDYGSKQHHNRKSRH